MTLDPGSILDGLTAEQQQAVTHIDGPMLVLAGPGSGKTRVITRRVAYLVAQGIPAWSILAVTFTNKAAGEMRDRIDAILPPELPGRRGLTVCTFHAFCARALRRYSVEAGLDPGFVIYDTSDQREAMKQALVECGYDNAQFTPASAAAAISDAKNALLDAEGYAAQAADFRTRVIARVYGAYERIMRAAHAVDFDDLLLLTAKLLRTKGAVLDELRRRFRYLLIDEYQDTNHAQFLIANAIAGDAGAAANIFVVGDPDQSIYGWRGADLRNILDFEKHHPSAKVVPLGQNFRSTGHIVSASAALIECNLRRKAKPLFTSLEPGQPVRLIRCLDGEHEAEEVVLRLRKLHEEGVPYREMAVLYRVNALSRVVEAALRDAQVPYVVARGTAFFDRKEVRDALAYLRFIANPADDVALRRIIATPPRGIGANTLEKIELAAVRAQSPLYGVMLRADGLESLNARAKTAVREFVALIESLRTAAQGDGRPATPSALAHFILQVIRRSGLEALYAKETVEDGQDRAANLNELVSAAAQFRPGVTALDDGLNEFDENGATGSSPAGEDAHAAGADGLMDLESMLRAFLESVALVSDADVIDPERGAVTLMTLHAAKGLEFDVVAMIGLEAGTLPHQRGLESETELEEERRLCYVGMTRARRHLLMTSAACRTLRGENEVRRPSQFLSELPTEAIERVDATGGVPFDGRTWKSDGKSDGGSRGGEDGPRLVRDLDERAPFGGLSVGSIVRHERFGIGRIEALMPRGSSSSARVNFRESGIKTLVLEYARLERLA